MSGLSPNRLMLEITESAIMVNAARALETLTALHDMGVRVSIDDFGTGYSSLVYLRRLPADEIKIDRSFVLDMARNEDDAFIAELVINLAHNLGLQVVAEGVSDKETCEMLAAMHCDQLQGFHVGRPMTSMHFLQWLAKQDQEPSWFPLPRLLPITNAIEEQPDPSASLPDMGWRTA